MGKNIPNLKLKFEKDISSKLAKEFNIKNPMAIPEVKKVIINSGIGAAIKNKELIESTTRDLAAITGQKPAIRSAKISVASFGIRRGMPVGLKVTLRGNKMYYFLEKLFSITLPRLRDFRGLPLKSFDKHGNYTLGLEEQTVFSEIDLSNVVKPFGLEITIVTNSRDVKKAQKLLELLGMPFEKQVKGES